MIEYISRESVINITTETGAWETQNRVRELPAEDVQPIKRGKWIDCTFYDPCEKSWEQEYEFKCSNCEHKIYNKPGDNNLFCSHCGTRMDGVAKNTITTTLSKEVEEHE